MGKFTHFVKSQIDMLKLIRVLAYICAGFCLGYAVCYLIGLDKNISIKTGIVLAGMPYAWTIVPIIPLGTLTTALKLVVSIALGWIITPIALILRIAKIIANVFKGISLMLPDKKALRHNQNNCSTGYPMDNNQSGYQPQGYYNQQMNQTAYPSQGYSNQGYTNQYPNQGYANQYPNQGYANQLNQQADYNQQYNQNAYYNQQGYNPYANSQNSYDYGNTGYYNQAYDNYSQYDGYYSNNTNYVPVQRQCTRSVAYQDSFKR